MQAVKHQDKGFRSPEILSWALFDFANSSYGVLFLALLFPVFYRQRLAGDSGQADLYWGLCMGASVAIAALISPIIGAIADRGYRLWALVLTNSVCVVATAALSYSGEMPLMTASLIFITSNLAYALSLSVYDSFLSFIAPEAQRGRISGFGWSCGYLGGIVATLALIPWYKPGFIGEHEANYTQSFVLVALFMFLISVPAFYYLPRQTTQKTGQGAFARLHSTWILRSEYSHVFRLIGGFAVVFVGLNTIFSFFTIYAAATLKASVLQLTILFLLFQVVGLPATYLSGLLGDRYGLKRMLLMTILGWIVVVALLLLHPSMEALYVVAALAGCLSGPCQSSARAMASRLIPQEKSSELFGVFSLAARVAGSIGPALFGVISWLTASQPTALALNLFFFGFGALILSSLPELTGQAGPQKASN